MTGVKWGFRLVLLVWTRHPEAQVPKDQSHVCYFRPGSGQSIWLTEDDTRRWNKNQGSRRDLVLEVLSDEEVVEQNVLDKL